jgi:cyclin B
MRAILVDWLVEVHAKFRLEPVTLYLCVNIVDRYLSLVQIDRSRLQLVGITALLLASKYEDIYPPDIKDCVYVADRSFTRQDVIDMEEDILRELDFNLTVPTAYPFLQRFLCITKASRTMEWAANYYLDRVLQEYGAINFRPSLLAAAAVCLALNHPEIREHDDVEEEKPGVVRCVSS